MKLIDPNNQVQKEALLNEYKGNLFEFLVGLQLSKRYSLEIKFYQGLNVEIKERLALYEEFIRINYPELAKSLIKLAEQTELEISIYLNTKNFFPSEIHLIGKSVATNDNNLWSETDLVLIDSEKNNLNLSLKLAKDNSYTNTKSAGVKSFFEKYFKNFASASTDQLIFNRSIDLYFNQMGEALYSSEGLNFKGIFDSDWTSNYPSLPGELIELHRKIVFLNYEKVAADLYLVLKKYYEENYNAFFQSVLPLMGFGDLDIVQVVTYHQQHNFKECKIFQGNDYITNTDLVQLIPISPGAHFFEIIFDSIVLQIRIKPMNKFTTASYKINCSVKGF
jgi:hypothetical protein